ncbi:MAG TPA: polysaccharide biosynthesis/export family protein, partial [Nitrococcus sp.]|nr:polysaccharide biosynthesis/export family protein [Nitrococcus sp.]
PPAPAPQSYTVIGITPQLVAQQVRARSATSRANLNEPLEHAIDQYRYRVGPQDVLSVVVWDHPELTLPQGQYRSAQETGYVVRADGTIFYPYVGRVLVAGKTTEEIRVQLTRLLAPYIKKPQLDVNVVGFHSKKFQLAGAITKPGLYPITNIPLTVSQAIAQAGGVLHQQPGSVARGAVIPRDLADLSHVLLIRNGKRQELNLYAFYQHGDQSQDRLIQPGDIIEVPDNSFNQVHLLGELRDPGNYPMNGGELNLAQALGDAGGVDLTTADTSRIFVFRGAPGGPQVFWLDSGSPDALLLATRFQLQAQDVVYVSTSDLSRFNRIVSQILPTVQAIYETEVLVNPRTYR